MWIVVIAKRLRVLAKDVKGPGRLFPGADDTAEFGGRAERSGWDRSAARLLVRGLGLSRAVEPYRLGCARAEHQPRGMSLPVVSEGGLEPPFPVKGTSTSS